MIKNYIKAFLKRNKLWLSLFSNIICFYLKFVYFSSRWQFIDSTKCNSKSFSNLDSTIFAIWHNRLAFTLGIKGNKNTAALVSPHSDGKLISTIIAKFNYEIIEGSSNKNSTGAIKQIIQKLSSKYNIVITPDGPRGPKYKIQGNITNIARKYGKNLIPVACSCTKFIQLKSWDQLIIPLPFGKIIVMIGDPVNTIEDSSNNDEILEKILINMTNTVDDMARKL